MSYNSATIRHRLFDTLVHSIVVAIKHLSDELCKEQETEQKDELAHVEKKRVSLIPIHLHQAVQRNACLANLGPVLDPVSDRDEVKTEHFSKLDEADAHVASEL